MGCEQAGEFVVDFQHAAVANLEGLLEAFAEHAYQGQYGHCAGYDAFPYHCEVVPAEYHKYYCGADEQEGYYRVDAEEALGALGHHFAACRVGLFHAFAKRFVVWLEEYGTEGGREGKGVYGRETDGDCHGKTELLIKYARGTRHERYRDEHQHHYQSDGYKGRGDFVHGVD